MDPYKVPCRKQFEYVKWISSGIVHNGPIQGSLQRTGVFCKSVNWHNFYPISQKNGHSDSVLLGNEFDR